MVFINLMMKKLLPMLPKHSSMADTGSSGVPTIRRFTALASNFNCGVIALTLGSYGLSVPTPVFWLCWSLLVIQAIILYAIRPYWKWATPSQESANGVQPCDIAIAGAVFLKVGITIALIIMLIYKHDFRQRENLTLYLVGLSIMLSEGFPQTFLVGEEFESLMKDPWGKAMEIRKSIIDGHNWEAVNFLMPSVVNSMICVTGGIVVGGNLGSLMPQKAYWILVLIVVADLMAEGIHRFSCGSRSLDDLNSDRLLAQSRYIGAGLRMLVGGFLCYYMVKEICQKSYFPSHMEVKACDRVCQVRSKMLLMAMVVLGGFQAVGILTTPLCAHVLAPQYVPCVFYAILLFGCLLFFLIWPFAKFLQILKSVVKCCQK